MPPGRYLLTTFGITWASWWTLAGLGGVEDGPAPLLLVGGAGPLIGAIAVRDAAERRELLHSTVGFDRIGAGWPAVLAVGLGPAALAALAGVVGGAVDAPDLGGAAAALAFALIAGLAEEPGWRGTLQPAWTDRHGEVAASLRVGLVWAVWHLPLYFARGTYQHDRGLWWFLVSLVELPALSVLLTWAYRRAGWLVAAPVLAHALGNAAGELLPDGGTVSDVVQSLTIVAGGALCAALAFVRRRRTVT